MAVVGAVCIVVILIIYAILIGRLRLNNQTIRDKKVRERVSEIIKAACELKEQGVKTLKTAASVNGRDFNREEMAFALGCITEKVGLAKEEKYKFGSIIVVDLR